MAKKTMKDATPASAEASQETSHMILTLSCKDRPGIVAAVAGYIAENGGNITESHQFGDPDSGRHFMRTAFDAAPGVTADDLRSSFRPISDKYEMEWNLHDTSVKQRVMILVSQTDHCTNTLLYRWRTGMLDMDVTSIVSNHAGAKKIADHEGLAFNHLPITKETKLEQETALVQLIKDEKVDLVILARYMQILSDGLVAKLSGKCINIHHSFLPSFKGARPYHQAHARGVKLIGATAHYVTSDLDEGPIIEQETHRVDHAMSASDFVATGRDIEAAVLSRAVKYHLERRVLMNGQRTVVFK